LEVLLNESLVVDIESRAVEMAGEAGRMLRGHFDRSLGSILDVEYKDKKKQQDPVTSADKESQAYLSEAISRHFPGHGILGEEGPSDESGASAPDFLWVLDPLDGTTNFLNGLPIYAVSIGVLHRGAPLVGALFIPWPGEEGGYVLHARRGGGAWMNSNPISIQNTGKNAGPQPEAPEANRLAGLPASFGAQFRLRKGLRRRVGEPRVTGSIAYEMALTAQGAFQYVVFGGPKIWDVAAGVTIVMEAGGAVLVRRRRSWRWEPLTTLGPSWESGPPDLKEVRSWTAPLIAGNTAVAPFVAANLQRRFPLSARVARLVRRMSKMLGESR
jgi:myo-inositol-1(or 4)-monophosphatase